MRLDKNYKVPEGFLPILNYRNTQDGEPVVGECRLSVPGDRDLEFWIGDPIEVVPVLPLKAHGELWHTGWDIPTVWVVDGGGQCWMDNAHGHCLCQVPSENLLGEAENENERNRIRKSLGLPPEEPEWMRLAKAAGGGNHPRKAEMKIETVFYPEKLLKEEGSCFDMRLHLTEEEMLSLVSSLTAAVHEYRTKGIEYEIAREVDVSHRQASGAKKKPKPVVGHGHLVFRIDRPKR